MMNTRKVLNEGFGMVFALGVALMWTLGAPIVAEAQTRHTDHDHAASSAGGQAGHIVHAEGETDDEHPVSPAGLAEASAGQAHAEDEHGGHDHAAHGTREKHDGHEDHDETEKAKRDDDDGHEDHTDDPEGHTEHSGHDEEGLRLTPEQRKRFGIVVRSAGPGKLLNEVSLPGEIVFNEDRVVHMVPRVAGIANKVYKSVGDRVKAGEVLAVIDSRELADSKAEYLAAKARETLEEKNFTREKALREKLVSSEQDFLEAEQARAEARIELRSAEQKLHALGLAEGEVEDLSVEHDEEITRYEIRSPITGIVAQKHIALGESLETSSDIFTVVDMSSVWVNLTVYTKNLDVVQKGQTAALRADHSGAQGRGQIAMVTPFVEEATRSATARVVLDNSDGRWIPGTFITGSIGVSEENIDVTVPRDAVQVIEGRSVVFVEHEGAFEITSVTTGRADRENIEILTGLKAGEPYVAKGAFELKATVITSNLGSHAGHGH